MDRAIFTKLHNLSFFPRKHGRHCNKLKAQDETVTQTEVRCEADVKSAAKTRHASSNSVSEELLDQEQQYQVSSSSELPEQCSNFPTLNGSMKSFKVIFPSTTQTKYEHMFLLERIAFIYIELVIKRGYKAMTSWLFRNLAR